MLVNFNKISFGRTLHLEEQQDAQQTMAKALKYLDKEFGIIFPDSMAPNEQDTGMNTMSNENSQKMFLSFLLQNGIKLHSLQDVPNGMRKKTDPSPFVTNSSLTDIFRIDLQALTTKDYGRILSDKTFSKIIEENKTNNPYINNFKYAVKNREDVQQEIYDTFTEKLKSKDILDSQEKIAISNLSDDFKKVKQKKGDTLIKFALYDILIKVHNNDYYPNWANEVDKNLFNEKFDLAKRQERLQDLKQRYSKNIDAFIFAQMLSDKFIEKEIKTFQKKGINIYNDIPICFSDAEVWAQPNLFSENLRLGSNNNYLQLWDFYIPDPKKLFKKDGSLGDSGKLLYDKYKTCFEKYKYGARIDHVLGLINPWIYDKNDPKNGTRLFEKLFPNEQDKILMKIILPAAKDAKIDTQNIIAEDLGYFKDEQREALKKLNCTTMNLTRYKTRERALNAKENTVALAGSHDDITLVTQEKNKLPKGEKPDWKLIKQNVKGRFVDLFICPSKKVQIFISDIMGMTAEYKPFDCSAKNRWLLRIVPDTYKKHYQQALQANMGFNMPEILYEACVKKNPDFVEEEPILASKLKNYSKILKEKE